MCRATNVVYRLDIASTYGRSSGSSSRSPKATSRRPTTGGPPLTATAHRLLFASAPCNGDLTRAVESAAVRGDRVCAPHAFGSDEQLSIPTRLAPYTLTDEWPGARPRPPEFSMR
jgi:hypothetical protein